nr:small integral membrane protein 26-like [Loxodonta africana]
MRPQQAKTWYLRMSALYAFGAWTVLGSLFLLPRKKDELPERKWYQESDGDGGDEVEQKEVSTIELPELPEGFYVETIVTYKEGFVPITEKIYNYLKSWTGGPGAES